jgi:hypothetical protein
VAHPPSAAEGVTSQHDKAVEPPPRAPLAVDASTAAHGDASDPSVAAVPASQPCAELGWERRIFREDMEESFAIRTQLTWVLSRGPEGKICVAVAIRSRYGYLRHPRAIRRELHSRGPS